MILELCAVGLFLAYLAAMIALFDPDVLSDPIHRFR